jgi:hypothetical protein
VNELKGLWWRSNSFSPKRGRYPERLEGVVLEFISEIPKAKYVELADKFRYSYRTHATRSCMQWCRLSGGAYTRLKTANGRLWIEDSGRAQARVG